MIASIKAALSRDNDMMSTIRDMLKEFLAETGEGNRRSMSSPFMIIDLFGRRAGGKQDEFVFAPEDNDAIDEAEAEKKAEFFSGKADR